MTLVCTLSRLVWQSNLSKIPCDGVLEQISKFRGSVNHLLSNNKCLGGGEKSYTTAELLMNRLTPHLINQESMGGIEVCKTHKVTEWVHDLCIAFLW